MISQVFWTRSQDWAFQYVDGYFNLYNSNGDYVTDFKDFEIMCDFISAQERKSYD